MSGKSSLRSCYFKLTVQRTFNKTNVLLFFLIALSGIWYLPYLTPGGNDREIFRCIGRLLNDGLVPYRDVFDHKTPVIYFVFFLFKYFGFFDTWVAGFFMLTVSVFMVHSLLPKGLVWQQLLIPFFLIVWLRNPLIYEYGGLTREFTAYLYCIYLFVFFKRRGTPWLFFIAGLVTINQPNDVLPLLPTLLYTLFLIKGKRIKNLAIHTLLFIAPIVGVCIWLGTQNALSDFYKQAVEFNFKYYSGSVPVFSVDRMLHSTQLVFDKLGFGLIGLALIAFLPFFNAKPTLPIIALISLMLGFFNAMLTGRFYGHYFLPIGPLLVFVWLTTAQGTSGKKGTVVLSFCIWMSFVVSVFWSNKAYSFQKQHTAALQTKHILDQTHGFILKHARQVSGLYLINYSPALPLYHKTGLKPPVKYLYFSIWDEIPDWDRDLNLFKEISLTLKSDALMIIDFRCKHPFVRTEMNQILTDRLQSDYELIGTITDTDQSDFGYVYLPKNPKRLNQALK